MTDDDRTVTVRIPLVFKKHGGRKTVISPDGAHLGAVGRRSSTAPWSGRLRGRSAGRGCSTRGRTGPSTSWRRPKASASPTSAECCG